MYRFAARADLPEIARFLPELGGPHFHERLRGRTVEQFYEWKYFRNPYGNAIVGVAESNSRIVSTVAAVPVQAWCGPAYLLGDFLTDREHRGHGHFGRLLEMVCAEAERRGAAFVYVQPNDQSGPILLRRGFTEVARLQQRHTITPRWPFVDALCELVTGVRSAGLITSDLAIAREPEYLNWRYQGYAMWRAADGYAVTAEIAGIGYIVDVVSPGREALRTALRSLRGRVRSVYSWSDYGCPRAFPLKDEQVTVMARTFGSCSCANRQFAMGDFDGI